MFLNPAIPGPAVYLTGGVSLLDSLAWALQPAVSHAWPRLASPRFVAGVDCRCCLYL